MTEIWKPVVDYEIYYLVSNMGRVRSLDRVKGCDGAKRDVKGRILSTPISSNGYPCVKLSAAGIRRTHTVHKLVLAAFVGPRPHGLVTRHLNGNYTDPRLVNLVYGTYSENMCDIVVHGKHQNANKTHCPQGHRYAGWNLIVSEAAGRQCRKCLYDNQARYRQRKREMAS